MVTINRPNQQVHLLSLQNYQVDALKYEKREKLYSFEESLKNIVSLCSHINFLAVKLLFNTLRRLDVRLQKFLEQ